jgi:hypothetical protein
MPEAELLQFLAEERASRATVRALAASLATARRTRRLVARDDFVGRGGLEHRAALGGVRLDEALVALESESESQRARSDW